jgi:3'-phosphoadenosine 5'-phosphosulfate sulfotransferase (PAPS reductase)/FAD synthetase
MSDPTMKESLEALRIQAESWKPEEVLSWAFATFGDNVAIATGLGVEGMALLDIAVKVNPDVKVFTGDTEFLFSETYDLIDRVEKRYAIKIASSRSLHRKSRSANTARRSGPAIPTSAALCAR